MLMQNKDLSNKNRNQHSEVAKNLTSALQSTQDPDQRKDFESIKIENAAEIFTVDNKRCYLVQVGEECLPTLHKVHSEITKRLESKFSNPVVIVPNRKRINGNLFRRYRGTKVPRTQTLTHVYDTLLQDIVYPAVIVGKRVRYPKSKGRLFKVQLDALDKESVEYKLNAIVASYKALTNRELQVEFQ